MNANAGPGIETVRFQPLVGHEPGKAVVVWPPPGKYTGEAAQARQVQDWATATMELARSARGPEVLYEYLQPTLADWIGKSDEMAVAEMEGAMALSMAVRHQVYKNFATPFASATDFVAYHLEKTGQSSDAPAVSKIVKSGDLLWFIVETALPLPARLSTIEPLAFQPDGLRIYQELVRRLGRPPRSSEVRKTLEDLGRYSGGSSLDRDYAVGRLARKGGDLLRLRPAGWEESLEDVFAQMTEVSRPKFKHRKRREVLPAWPAEAPCPFTLHWQPAQNAVLVRVDDRHLLNGVRIDLWKEAHESGWAELVSRDGWVVPLCDFDPAQLNSEKGELEEFFTKFCRRMGAPLPRLVEEGRP